MAKKAITVIGKKWDNDGILRELVLDVTSYGRVTFVLINGRVQEVARIIPGDRLCDSSQLLISKFLYRKMWKRAYGIFFSREEGVKDRIRGKQLDLFRK